MTHPHLVQQLHSLAVRIRLIRLWTSFAVVWAIAALLVGGALLLNRTAGWYYPYTWQVVIGGAGAGSVLLILFSILSARDYRKLARRVERAYPELDSALLTAIQQQPDVPGGRYGFLQDTVLRAAVYHSYRHPWRGAIHWTRLVAAQAAGLGAMAIFLGVLLSYGWWAVVMPRPHHQAFGDVLVGRLPLTVSVEPGNAEIEWGTSLLVLARFDGPIPAEATLVVADVSGQRRLQMAKSLDDPVFAARVPEVVAPLDYWVQYADRLTDKYHVSVFQFPRLVRSDAELQFPDYTRLEPKTIQDVRRVSAVQGTRVTLLCHLNKPVASAELMDSDGAQTIPLRAGGAGAQLYSTELVLDQSKRYQLRLLDEQGRANKLPAELIVNVLPNRPPDLKMDQPASDVQVSPLEELSLRASAWDDYGLTRIGMSYALAGQAPKDVILPAEQADMQRVPISHVLAFEQLHAQPDQLLSYYFWAEDIAPDGQPRRTAGDMFFAEVRHFEEIFRQGQQPTGQQMQNDPQQAAGGQNARQAEQLAELQKQIISATWNLIRRETGTEVTDSFSSDLQLLIESQTSALAQLDQLVGQLQDPQSAEHAADVQRHMNTAVQLLLEARNTLGRSPLEDALAAEQAAYQGLLKLRAREHQVVRGNRQSSQQNNPAGGSDRAQQQMQQLQLRDDQNRYESQRLAQPEQTAEQRENRQVLNRLRELARRQQDLNQRIKELQSALDETQTEPQREEIEKQLKRLREQQQEILRDTDELLQRMERPENQESMSPQRQQLDRARENIRQSSEALQEGQVTRAAADGTRAEQQLRELRDEFQQRTSGQFSDRMRQIRDQARQLEENQQQLSEQLAELDPQQADATSLRSNDSREAVAEQFQQQQQELAELLDRVRQTVQEAEPYEPLLAEDLYDTYRRVQQAQPERALQSTTDSLRLGFLDDARDEENRARDGISQLRQGIDNAAENVLGDETEALRRANRELQRLNQELETEIDRFDPQSEPGGENDANPQPSEPREGGAPTEPSDERPASDPSADPQPGQQARPDETGQPPSGGQGNRAETAPQRGGNPRGDQANPGAPRGGNPNPPSRSSGIDDYLQPSQDQPAGPITGEDYLDWSDRLRDVEEMIADPQLRAEASRIRESARSIRREFTRHSREPNWDLVRLMVASPLAELHNRVAQELLRRSAQQTLVPIDRDPVPTQYEESVRRYYQRLGSGQ